MIRIFAKFLLEKPATPRHLRSCDVDVVVVEGGHHVGTCDSWGNPRGLGKWWVNGGYMMGI